MTKLNIVTSIKELEVKINIYINKIEFRKEKKRIFKEYLYYFIFLQKTSFRRTYFIQYTYNVSQSFKGKFLEVT